MSPVARVEMMLQVVLTMHKCRCSCARRFPVAGVRAPRWFCC